MQKLLAFLQTPLFYALLVLAGAGALVYTGNATPEKIAGYAAFLAAAYRVAQSIDTHAKATSGQPVVFAPDPGPPPAAPAATLQPAATPTLPTWTVPPTPPPPMRARHVAPLN